MKRMRLPSDDLDDSHDPRSQQPGDIPRPSLTIRYPPVFDDDVTCQQYQYIQGRQRRQSYPPFVNPSDRGQYYPPDQHPFPYLHSQWQSFQGADDTTSNPYDQAVDFSLTRDSSQEAVQVRPEPPRVHDSFGPPTAHRFRSASATPGRIPHDVLRSSPDLFHSDRGFGHVSFLPQSPNVDPFSVPMTSRPDFRSGTFHTHDAGFLSGPMYQHFESIGPFGQGAIDPSGLMQSDSADRPTGHRYGSGGVKQCREADATERLVYYDMDTPQSSQSAPSDRVTSDYKIKEETIETPLQLRGLLPIWRSKLWRLCFSIEV